MENDDMAAWSIFAQREAATPADQDGAADGTPDGEFTVAAPAALPAQAEEFLSLKAANAF
jgi:hypothetical protein